MKKTKILKLFFVTPVMGIPLVAASCSKQRAKAGIADSQYLNAYNTGLQSLLVAAQKSFVPNPDTTTSFTIKKTDIISAAEAAAKRMSLDVQSNYNPQEFSKITAEFTTDNQLAGESTNSSGDFVFTFGGVSVFLLTFTVTFNYTLTLNSTNLKGTSPTFQLGSTTLKDFKAATGLDSSNITSFGGMRTLTINDNPYVYAVGKVGNDYKAFSGKKGTGDAFAFNSTPSSAIDLPDIADNYYGTQIVSYTQNTTTNHYLLVTNKSGTLQGGNRVAFSQINNNNGNLGSFSYIAGRDKINDNIFGAAVENVGSTPTLFYAGSEGIYSSSNFFSSNAKFTKDSDAAVFGTKGIPAVFTNAKGFANKAATSPTNYSLVGFQPSSSSDTGGLYIMTANATKQITFTNVSSAITGSVQGVASNANGALTVVTKTGSGASAAWHVWYTPKFVPTSSGDSQWKDLLTETVTDKSALMGATSMKIAITNNDSVILGTNVGMWYSPNIFNSPYAARNVFKFDPSKSVIKSVTNYEAVTTQGYATTINSKASFVAIATIVNSKPEVYYLFLPNTFF